MFLAAVLRARLPLVRALLAHDCNAFAELPIAHAPHNVVFPRVTLVPARDLADALACLEVASLSFFNVSSACIDAPL